MNIAADRPDNEIVRLRSGKDVSLVYVWGEENDPIPRSVKVLNYDEFELAIIDGPFLSLQDAKEAAIHRVTPGESDAPIG